MAVYTHLARSQLDAVVAQFSIGSLLAATEANDGIENSTYFLSCSTGEHQRDYVLTLFEQLSTDELPFYIALLTTLANQGLPVPRPLIAHSGQPQLEIAHRPALLFERSAGKHITEVTSAHCRVIGDALANIHLAAATFPLNKPNSRGLAWMQESASTLHASQDSTQQHLMARVLAIYRHIGNETDSQLPRGVIHGDLFRDNALFVGSQLSAVIDFYNACTDSLLLDLAITVNDWCSTLDGDLNLALTEALLQAYDSERPLTKLERAYWPDMLCIAAARFWVSRSLSDLNPAQPSAKDPRVYQRILDIRLATADTARE